MSLATRTGLLTAGVAALAVLVTGAIAYPLIRQAAVTQAQTVLAQQADVIAGLLTTDTSERGSAHELEERARALHDQGIDGFIVRSGAVATPPLEQQDVGDVLKGTSVSESRMVGGEQIFIEGRPLGSGSGVLLVQQAQVATTSTQALLKRLLAALAIGLVLSALVGWLASRRVTRSLRDAADAAQRLRDGDRDVRLTPTGPEEVAGIASSLNGLATALAVSENRQRTFLVSVSHELRTPLTAVKGYAEALRDGVVPPEDVERTGAIVAGEAGRLERLVSDLLDLSRAGAVDLRLDWSAVDLRQFAIDAGQVWRDRCEREGVTFSLEAPEGALTADTDALRLRQIVDNLAENALRVTPAGRPIVLAVRGEGPSAVVEVRDGGPGLSADDLAVAFDPEELYARYRGIRPVGTGIGLALVGSLASRLGGVAEAGNAPEGGARFTVTIPRSRPATA